MPNRWRRRSLWIAVAGALAAAADAQTGDSGAVCATCHRAIYDSYRATPMAHSAKKLDAPGVESLDRSTFVHSPSGFRYGVSLQNSTYQLTFENASKGSSGSKRLAYAVGSGVRAFSYLIADDGFLFEAPVAYYTASKAWGLAPGYDRNSYPFLTRPIVPGCLSCHASGVQADAGTLNRYGSPAFLEDGVTCGRCHGNGERHVAKMKSGDLTGGAQIVNPERLPAANRDSICAQCHLSGDVRVMRPGANWQSFQPGARLGDTQTVFVRSGKTGEVTVTGHVENLAASACKRISGDRLWCGSCHDPHKLPAPAEAADWFRSRCLSCHATKGCSEPRQARAKVNDNCVACHMPKSPAADAEHVVFTDHSIPRRPRAVAVGRAAPPDAELFAFNGHPAARDIALAYAIAAVGQSNTADRTRARRLLEQAAKEAPADVEVLVSLAEIYRNDGQGEAARPLYEQVLALDPGQLTALVGLGGVAMERNRDAEAIRLWTAALAKNSGLELVRMNLSLAQWRSGDRAGAEANLRKALEVNPAFAPARDVLKQIGEPAKK